MDLSKIINVSDGKYTINDKYNFVPSFVREDIDTPKIYVFLHIPKCGGIDFESSYKTALSLHCKNNNKPYLTSRADTEKDLNDAVKFFAENRVKDSGQNYYGIFTSHLGIKRLSVEKDIPLNNIITILRDPVDRIVSSFCYSCMRANVKPDFNDLDRFVKEEENINQISLLLENNNKNTDILENDIRKRFFACVDIEKSHVLLSEMLSRNNFANVIKENLNQTLPEFKIKKEDIPSKTLGSITQLNAKDIDLYHRFKNNPVMPELIVGEKINSYTLLSADEQTQEASMNKNLLVNTEAMLSFLYNNRSTLTDRLGLVIDQVAKA